MRRFLPTVLLCLVSFAARADPVRLHYAAYAAGLNVLVIDATLDLSPRRYRVTLGYRTAGTFALFVRSAIETQVDGVFVDGVAAPTRLFSAGTLRGETHVTQIDYVAGQPVLRQLVPPTESEREPVPPEQRRGTVDTLSAMAQLIQRVNDTGRCEGTAHTFDGRRAADLRAWTIGFEELPPTRLSSYAGRALHCDFQGRQTGGFVHDEDLARLQRPQSGSAWFAALAPGQPMVPVRISFQTRWFGDATMFIAPPD